MYTLRDQDSLNLAQDHLCLLYDSTMDLCSCIAPVLTTALLAGSQVLCIRHGPGQGRLVDYLRGTGWDIDPYLFNGQLCFETVERFFLSTGSFDPQRIFEFLERRINEALLQGFSNLFLITDMGWILGGVRGSERLIEYEAELNVFLSGKKCSVLCMYGLREFTPAILLYVLVTHPKLVGRSSIVENIHYGTPPHLLTGDSASNILGRWLGEIKEPGSSRPDHLSEEIWGM